MSTTMKYGHLSEKEKLRWELESLRQENSRLREALEKIASNQSPGSGGLTAVHLLAHIADEALNPPKNR